MSTNRTKVLDETYPTFNALGRSALVFGIPLTPLMLLVGVSTIITMTLFIFINGTAMFFLVIPIPIAIMMKVISANDDQALTVTGYELMCWYYRRNASFFNGTTTLLATQFGRKQNDYQRFFEQSAPKSNLVRDLFAEGIPTYHR